MRIAQMMCWRFFLLHGKTNENILFISIKEPLIVAIGMLLCIPAIKIIMF